MHIVTVILAALVAVEHLYFMYLEMFAWTKASTRRAFGTTAEFAEASKTLAANQGLYNFFLAAGLVWALVDRNPPEQRALVLFFAGCVVVAGIYGGVTVSRRILLVQALPAALCFLSALVLR